MLSGKVIKKQKVSILLLVSFERIAFAQIGS